MVRVITTNILVTMPRSCCCNAATERSTALLQHSHLHQHVTKQAHQLHSIPVGCHCHFVLGRLDRRNDLQQQQQQPAYS
jgi:hypothetical protein